MELLLGFLVTLFICFAGWDWYKIKELRAMLDSANEHRLTYMKKNADLLNRIAALQPPEQPIAEKKTRPHVVAGTRKAKK